MGVATGGICCPVASTCRGYKVCKDNVIKHPKVKVSDHADFDQPEHMIERSQTLKTSRDRPIPYPCS